jgi:hypothetical protein
MYMHMSYGKKTYASDGKDEYCPSEPSPAILIVSSGSSSSSSSRSRRRRSSSYCSSYRCDGSSYDI